MENDVTSTSDDSTVPARYKELQQLVAAMAPDFEKFYTSGNKAAGTRVRTAMQALKAFAQSVRTEVQDMKNKAAGGPSAEA